MMRIITGKARGVRLTTLAGDNTRPTSERAKEAVFSMLQFDLNHTNVLDLFAGSGQMGLEALSRGADNAVLCDRSREAVEVIRANATKTKLLPQCEIACADFYTQLKSMRKKKRFDIVFLDPPYALGVLPQVSQTLLDFDLLQPHAKIVCESAEEQDVFGQDAALEARFDRLRCTRYGAAFVTVLQCKEGGEALI